MSKKKLKNKSLSDMQNIYFLIPLIFIITIVPLLVYVRYYSLDKASAQLLNGSKVVDVFSYYKSLYFLIAIAIGLVMLIVKAYIEKVSIKLIDIYIPMGVYSLFIILSTLFSKQKETVAFGFFERYEGMFVLLGYILAAVLVINFVNSEKGAKIILYSLAASAVIIFTIGLFQYLGLDFFGTEFAKDLIIPSDLRPHLTQFDITAGKHNIYATMFNPNYVGSYVALLLPVALAFLINAKKVFAKIVSLAFLVIVLLNLVGSGSRAGVVGCAVSLVLLAVLYRKKLWDHRKLALCAAAGLIIVAVSFDFVSGGRIINKVKSVFSGTESSQSAVYLKDLRIDKNKMTIVTDRNQISIVYENGNVSFNDLNNNSLKTIVTDQGNAKQITLEDKQYSDFNFSCDNQMQYMNTTIGNMSFRCYLFPDKLKILGPFGRLYDIQQAPSFGFNGQEKLGSGRGYIWSRSIPMLKDTLLIGHGPDTFTFYFPHDDFIGMLNAYGNTRTNVDKAHSMFLQIGLNTGVLSLIAILVLFLMYFISSIKLYFRRKISTWLDVTGACLLCSFTGYLFAGLFNDSTINVAPVFWVLFGLGIAVNQVIKRQDEKAEKAGKEIIKDRKNARKPVRQN